MSSWVQEESMQKWKERKVILTSIPEKESEGVKVLRRFKPLRALTINLTEKKGSRNNNGREGTRVPPVKKFQTVERSEGI